VPLRRVHIRRPWRGTLAIAGGGTVGNHGGVAGGVATVVSTIVVVLAATTAVAVVVVPMPIVVAAVTVAGAAAVVLAKRARRRQMWRRWSGQRFVGVERHQSNSWTGGVQVDFLHHGIRLDVEVGEMVSTYDEEAVAVSVVKKYMDPRTSFLAVACSSRS
jgi:hypothetical protein